MRRLLIVRINKKINSCFISFFCFILCFLFVAVFYFYFLWILGLGISLHLYLHQGGVAVVYLHHMILMGGFNISLAYSHPYRRTYVQFSYTQSIDVMLRRWTNEQRYYIHMFCTQFPWWANRIYKPHTYKYTLIPLLVKHLGYVYYRGSSQVLRKQDALLLLLYDYFWLKTKVHCNL